MKEIKTIGGYVRVNNYYPYTTETPYAGEDHELGVQKFDDLYKDQIKTEKYTAASDKAYNARKALFEFKASSAFFRAVCKSFSRADTRKLKNDSSAPKRTTVVKRSPALILPSSILDEIGGIPK